MSVSPINLRHFRVFLAVVQCGSLQGAALQLHITLSAVSKTLAELEAHLNARLLERGRGGLHLTAAGERFQQQASRTVAQFEQALEPAAVSPERPLLRIGALPTAAGFMLPPVIAQVREAMPGVRVQVASGMYDYLVGKLRTGDIDLIVGRLIGRDMLGVAFEALYEEDLLVVVRQEHPLASLTQPTLADLRPYTLIASPPGTLVRITVDNFLLAQGGGEELSILESLSETFSRVCVQDQDAVWFVQRGLVDLDLRLGLVRALPFKSPLLRAPVGVTTPTDRSLSEPARLFVQLARRFR